MTIFSLVMLITALLFLYFVIRKINKNIILIDQAAMWLVLGLLMLVSALFPIIPDWLARMLGFQLTSNFILFLAIIVLMVLQFLQTLQISKQKEDIKNLIQEISMLKKGLIESENKDA
ncbi:DUF2304 domain-containing protein [Streptococcus acidominimus]|uniref:DUF2304 domain-containing protein n=1 Tax=Streptococcus acidominimus TaxID=1326 RepID=A0A4Y9FPZ0_STRAI|nr:DUF2304 domain-containing protein [Streptococcus acidominimus]MBF0818576.1 DUF2304 domain-containing protein [Streptococcus acidominimus]MBF0838218.1 DUF2304 domain-containing protein [Streptococcus acidominimus]MBF0847998.1 DUF2304 domain-containing protein [Streptococcus danieliae]TFU31076.1 DUF2304 domain-containing protein [Streptococcus acidominimus]